MYGAFGFLAKYLFNCKFIYNNFIVRNNRGNINLPGIVGIVLTIGMAVDANVLIFERIKEENQKKANVYQTLKRGLIELYLQFLMQT